MRWGRKWKLLLLIAIACLSFSQSSFAQDDYPNNSDNNGNYNNGDNYDNSDEALIQPENDVNYSTFHNELTPYGRWVDYPGYGNVWVCNIADFRPYYTGGHWAYTRFGWTWVSDYNWGWAPFHYGRWAFDNAYGWFWVPGYTWGPAWVSWRTGGDYYGWAPLSPGLSIGINVGIGIPAASWVFLPHRYMGYRSINPYYANRGQNVTIIRNTTIINNTNVYNNNRFVVGPSRNEVERYSGQRIQQQNIYVSNRREVNRPDRSGIYMYNPNANRGAVINRGDNRMNNRNFNDNRQQPFGRQPMQNGVQQPGNEINRPDRANPNFGNGNNSFQNDQLREQRMQNMQNRMQQQNDERRLQMEQMRQQQNNDLQRQQMNDRRQQMQDQMMQQRQQQDMQRQQQMQQRQEMMQQRQQQVQQMQQQRQQQVQRNQNFNRPAPQQSGGWGGRRRN